MRGVMCVEITDWMCRVRVVLSWSRIVWLREDGGLDIVGRELYSEYAGGRVFFSFRDIVALLEGHEDRQFRSAR
jgi:hypothetical protein